jgi:hypothetical protein
MSGQGRCLWYTDFRNAGAFVETIVIDCRYRQKKQPSVVQRGRLPSLPGDDGLGCDHRLEESPVTLLISSDPVDPNP